MINNLYPFFGLCWCQQVTYVHSMGLQLKSTFVPPATFLHSPVLPVKTQKPQAFRLLHCYFSNFSFSIQKSLHQIKISMLFLDHKSNSFHSGIVLKLWVWLYFGGFTAECAFWFKSQGIEKLNFSPKGPRTVKIWDMKSLIIADPR